MCINKFKTFFTRKIETSKRKISHLTKCRLSALNFDLKLFTKVYEIHEIFEIKMYVFIKNKLHPTYSWEGGFAS